VVKVDVRQRTHLLVKADVSSSTITSEITSQNSTTLPSVALKISYSITSTTWVQKVAFLASIPPSAPAKTALLPHSNRRE